MINLWNRLAISFRSHPMHEVSKAAQPSPDSGLSATFHPEHPAEPVLAAGGDGDGARAGLATDPAQLEAAVHELRPNRAGQV